MKIEVGKTYLTVTGYSVTIVRRSEIPTGDYLGNAVIGGVTYQFYYHESGYVANMEYPGMTLVEEVVDKTKEV